MNMLPVAWQHSISAAKKQKTTTTTAAKQQNPFAHSNAHTQQHTPTNSCCCRQKRLSLLLLLLSSHIEHDRRTSTSFVQPSYDHSHEARTASPAQSATNCCCCRLPVGILHACVSCAFSLPFKTRVFFKNKKQLKTFGQ